MGDRFENKTMTEKEVREAEFTDCVFARCKFTETEFYSWAVIPEMNMALFCEATAQTKQMLFGLLLTPAQQAIYI